jgi:hypothetical protein
VGLWRDDAIRAAAAVTGDEDDSFGSCIGTTASAGAVQHSNDKQQHGTSDEQHRWCSGVFYRRGREDGDHGN